MVVNCTAKSTELSTPSGTIQEQLECRLHKHYQKFIQFETLLMHVLLVDKGQQGNIFAGVQILI